MKIDSFLEKILENNDSLVFGTNNVSNKKMLDMANDCAKNYCKYINIPIDAFCEGKELFKTIKYFMNDDHFYEECFIGLYGADLDRANNYIEGILNVIEEEEKESNFDVDIVCDSIINYLVLLESIKIDNLEEVRIAMDRFKRGEIEYEDINIERSLLSFDYSEIDIDYIRDLFFKIFDIKLVEDEMDKIQKKITKIGRYLSKDKVITVAGGAFTGGLACVNPLLGVAAVGLLNKGAKKLLKDIDKLISKYDELAFVWYRYQYWILILTACYNYYCKNYEEGFVF